jgi:transcriptional regulator with XRE-family HTH domain
LITSGQIRAARSLIKWTGKELAVASGIAFSTLMRLETGEGVPAAQAKTLDAIQKAFNQAGIEFIGTPEAGAGVRWKTK